MDKLLTLVGIGSVLVGPFFSGRVPMPPSIRDVTFWVSGLAALVSFLATAQALKASPPPKRFFVICVGGAIAFAAALAYAGIVLSWTTESGTWTDGAFRLLMVAVYSIGCGGLTIAAVGAKLAD